MSNLIGWEILRKTAIADFTKDADQIVAFVHWYLVQKAKFGCLGNGNDLKLLQSDVSSELLPADWNVNPKTYGLRYQEKAKIYVLLCTISDGTIILNLLSANKMELSNVQFATAATLSAIQSTVGTNAHSPTADVLAIIDRLNNELVQPVFESNSTTAETQTTAPEPATTATGDNRQSSRDGYYDNWDRDRGRGIGLIDPRDVGRGDLDPFGAGGGGMLYQPPMRPGGAGYPFGGPPDGRLPGARYDPFPQGPIGPPRRDGDHFQPPHWYHQ